MTKNNKIQIGLIFIGLFFFFGTYFWYPTINEDRLKGSVVQDKQIDTIDEKSKDNLFENVQYKAYYGDNPFVIQSEQAHIEAQEPDIVFLSNLIVTISMYDGRIVTIVADKGTYFKNTDDILVAGNVKSTDGETIIHSENLDLFASKDIVSIYNNVNLINKNGSLKADSVEYNIEAKYYRISMNSDNEKVKIKLIEWEVISRNFA